MKTFLRVLVIASAVFFSLAMKADAQSKQESIDWIRGKVEYIGDNPLTNSYCYRQVSLTADDILIWKDSSISYFKQLLRHHRRMK